jgi:hypothetical protein
MVSLVSHRVKRSSTVGGILVKIIVGPVVRAG